jgi:hypothetical protein
MSGKANLQNFPANYQSTAGSCQWGSSGCWPDFTHANVANGIITGICAALKQILVRGGTVYEEVL